MDRIAELSALARRIKATRADALTMRDYPRKRAALSWLDLARNSLAQVELGGAPLDIEDVTANIEAAQRIITGADAQKEIDMPTNKTAQPEVTADLATIIATAVAQAMAAQMATGAPPAAKPKNALPDPVKPTVAELFAPITATRATASTVVYSVPDHSVLWADRGLSIDRQALERLGNDGTLEIVIRRRK